MSSDQEYDSVDSSEAFEEDEKAATGEPEGAEPVTKGTGEEQSQGERSLEGLPTEESSGEDDGEEESDEEASESGEPAETLTGEVAREDGVGSDGKGGGEEEGEKEEGEEGGSVGIELESSDEEIDKSLDTTAESLSSQENPTRGVKTSGFLESDSESVDGEGGGEAVTKLEEGEEGGSAMGPGGRRFLDESDDDENETRSQQQQRVDSAAEQGRDKSVRQEDVFGDSGDEGEGEGEEDGGQKRKRSSPLASEGESEGEEAESAVKRLREASESEGEEDELRQELEDLEEGREARVRVEGEGEGTEGEGVPEMGGERVVGEGNEEEEDPLSDDEPGPSTAGMSDWEVMMQRRKEAMARARKRRKRDIDITAVDDHIMAMIREMRHAVEEDRQLNQAGQPALKKLKMLPTVVSNLKKSDLQTSFIECGILTVLAEWLSLLPDRSLPHLKIRESILDILKAYPVQESHILKSSRIGKAVMTLYKHPMETRKNKEKAGKIINEWARPIFGLASDFKSLGRDEREERDYANLSQATKRRLSSSSDPNKKSSQDEEYEPAKPGDKGWISRARVPMPSTRDYVVRPKWRVEHEYKRGPSKKVLNRYEKQINKQRQRKLQGKTSHAVVISVEGRKMPL